MATAPQGTARLQAYVRLMQQYPLVAIGGISAEQFPEILATGVGFIAVVRALVNAPDPDAAAQQLAGVHPRVISHSSSESRSRTCSTSCTLAQLVLCIQKQHLRCSPVHLKWANGSPLFNSTFSREFLREKIPDRFWCRLWPAWVLPRHKAMCSCPAW